MKYDAVVFDLLTALLDSWTLWNDVAGAPEDGMKWRRRYLKITYGWSLLLIVVFTVLYFRYSDAKAENRLDGGIDPVWLTRERASVDA